MLCAVLYKVVNLCAEEGFKLVPHTHVTGAGKWNGEVTCECDGVEASHVKLKFSNKRQINYEFLKR